MFEHILFLHKRSRLVVWWLVSIIFFKPVLQGCLEMLTNFTSFTNRKYMILIFLSDRFVKLN